MKKVFMTAVFLLIVSLAGICSAGSNYPAHLNGDPNYILCDGHMGIGWYLQRDSVKEEENAQDNLVLSFNLLTVYNPGEENMELQGRNRYRMLFEGGKGLAMYVLDSSGGKHYMDPNGPSSQTRPLMPAGEIAYYALYGDKFYGYKYNEFGNPAYDDDFYKIIPQ